MKNWLRVTICVMLIVSVLAMSLSVFAEGEIMTNPPEDFLINYIVDYMIATLNAWGIYVTEENLVEWEEEIEKEIFEYLADTPSIGGFGQWILPWAWTSDFWGNLVGNNSFLEDMEDFANWLVYKFQLHDNSVVTLPSNVYKLGGSIYVYAYPIYGFHITDNNNAEIIRVDVNTNYPVYVLFYLNDNFPGKTNYVRFTPKNSGKIQVDENYKDIVDNEIFSVTASALNSSVGTWYRSGFNLNYDYYALNQDFRLQSDYAIYNGEDVIDYLETYSYVLNTGLEIHTGDINLPSDDPSYTPGDSITIIDGDPVYIEITWPESVEVSNLPAVVSTNTINNPHLEEAYRPIQGLITYAKDGVAVCTALLYELPDELVYLWYGVIASIIIWGMIKLMREH